MTPPPAAGIDPRGPRFSASVTAALLLVVFVLSLTGPLAAALGSAVVVAALFAVGAGLGVRRHPFGLVYARLIAPRLSPPTEREDPAPPRFAQVVGLVVLGAGILLELVGVPLALTVASALAFVAAFLNGAFGYCIGCRLYVLLVRAGVLGRGSARAS